jgi:Flp pilus assembly pilin Flp
MHRESQAVCRDDRGATATEYALLVSMIALFIIGSVAAVGIHLVGVYDGACDDVASTTSGSSC